MDASIVVGIAIGAGSMIIGRLILHGLGIFSNNKYLKDVEHEIRCRDRLTPIREDLAEIKRLVFEIHKIIRDRK